jgi:nitrate reductase NapE component
MLSINPQAWNDFVRIEGQIRKQRQQEEAERRRKIKRNLEIAVVVLAIVLVGFAFGLMVWWVLYLRSL